MKKPSGGGGQQKARPGHRRASYSRRGRMGLCAAGITLLCGLTSSVRGADPPAPEEVPHLLGLAFSSMLLSKGRALDAYATNEESGLSRSMAKTALTALDIEQKCFLSSFAVLRKGARQAGRLRFHTSHKAIQRYILQSSTRNVHVFTFHSWQDWCRVVHETT